MNLCAVCDAPTLRAVHDRETPSELVPYCTACLEQRPIPEPRMSKNAAPLAPDTINEATLEADTAKRTLVALKALPVTMSNIDDVGRILVGVKTKSKDLEARLKAITAPMRAAEKSVRDLFRPALNALAEAEAVLKQGIADAQRAQLIANQQAHQAAQAALAQGDVRGAALAVHATAPITAPEGVTVRERQVFRVVDAELVPRLYCSPDEAKIAHAIAAGVQVPGVVVETVSQVSVRT